MEALPVSSHIELYRIIILTHFSQFHHYFHPPSPFPVDSVGVAEHTWLEHDAYVLMTAQVMTLTLHLHHPLKQNFATKRPIHTYGWARILFCPYTILARFSQISVFFHIIFSYIPIPIHHLSLLNIQLVSMYSLIFSLLNIYIWLCSQVLFFYFIFKTTKFHTGLTWSLKIVVIFMMLTNKWSMQLSVHEICWSGGGK
jgi:hypothetical protein